LIQKVSDSEYFYAPTADLPLKITYRKLVTSTVDGVTTSTSTAPDYYIKTNGPNSNSERSNYYTFTLDIPSGKMCFCGDGPREVFVEPEWGNMKYKNNYHYYEKDAIEHINYFLNKGYFYVPDCFYPTISKKGDEILVFRDHEEKNWNMGKIIDRLMINSDHTMIIIDEDLYKKKLIEHKTELDKLSDYDREELENEKYCLKVIPGTYEISFNWRFMLDEGETDDSSPLIYFRIKKK
jgi:hypothetical protein